MYWVVGGKAKSSVMVDDPNLDSEKQSNALWCSVTSAKAPAADTSS